MDHSKDYIRLCGQAQEIQTMWDGRHGDFYATGADLVKCMVEGCYPFGQIKQGYSVKYENGVLIRIAKCIWLPRLDQLMEMAQTKGRRFEKTTQAFFDWNKQLYNSMERLPKKLFTSLEQLWLCYIMEEKFAKHWNGEQWLKTSL